MSRAPSNSGLAPMRRAYAALFAVLVAATPGCMPLPEQGGLDISAGRLSDQWAVDWDPRTRTPVNMTNRSLQDESPTDKEPISEAAAAEAVRVVFQEYRDWFRLRPGVDDIRMVRSYPRGWLRFLRIEQTYKSVPVAGAGYDVRVLPGGRVGSLEGHFYPDIEMNITPVISAVQAEERALAAFAGVTAAPAFPQFAFEWQHSFADSRVLVIIPRDVENTLAWGIVIRTPPQGSSRVFVDASNGSVLGYQLIGTEWR